MTQRLERLIISGTARAVQTSPTGVEDHVGTLSLHVLPHEPLEDLPALLPVEIQTDLVPGQLTDGDEVEVTGMWDGEILDADKIVNLSAGARPKRPRPAAPAASPTAPMATSPKRRKRWALAALAVVAVIALTAGGVFYFTHGFGRQTRPGPIVKPVSAAVFSPDGTPDNP